MAETEPPRLIVEMPLAAVLVRVVNEFCRASASNPPFNSSHEGYAVLLEEVDELWDEVKRNAPVERMAAEAVQVAAMAVRFLMDICQVGAKT